MNDHREFKALLYDQFARIGKAVGNPHRFELLDLLAQGERSVDELARQAGLAIANASQHLQALKRANLVQVRRDGLYAFYRLADEQVARLCLVMRDLAESRLAEIDRLVDAYLGDRRDLEAVDAETLLGRVNDEDLVILDVRPAVEYQAGHIPSARSIPIDELERRLGEIPRNRDVVAYCRGPYCVFSDEAVRFLRDRGYRAVRLTVGLPEWRLAGLPVATSER